MVCTLHTDELGILSGQMQEPRLFIILRIPRQCLAGKLNASGEIGTLGLNYCRVSKASTLT